MPPKEKTPDEPVSLRHPVSAGPRPITGYEQRQDGKQGRPYFGPRPMKECEHRCVNCGALLADLHAELHQRGK